MRRSLVLAAVCLGAIAGVAPALAAQKRYTVTATYSGSYEEHWSRDYPGSKPPAMEWHEWAERSSYAARSVRSFVIRRSADGRAFAFDAKLAGSFSALGSGYHGSYGDYAGDNTSDPQECLATSGMSSTGNARVQGVISALQSGRTMWVGAAPVGPAISYASETVCSPSGFTWPVRDDNRSVQTTLGWEVDASQLRKRFGHAFTIASNYNYEVGVDGERAPNRNRLVLRFTPVGGAQEDEEPERQRWQIEVTGRDRWSWGMYTTLGAGINVKWAHRTTLDLEDSKIVSATGKVRVVDVTPFSDVTGAFTVGSKTTTPSAYAIPQRSKSGDRVQLGLLKLGSSEYRADFTVQAGPQLLQALRGMGVPDPDGRYRSMVARGPVPNTVVSLVPAEPRVSVRLQPGVYRRETAAYSGQLPCTQFKGQEPECFLTRGGEIITVTRIR